MRLGSWALALIISVGQLQAQTSFDYEADSRLMIRNGVQAVLTCNGLYTSHRSPALVDAEELAYLKGPRFGGVAKAQVEIHDQHRAVTIGGGSEGTAISAAFREGIGCVVLAPDQTLADIETLPELPQPKAHAELAQIPWPDGDQVTLKSWPRDIDRKKFKSATKAIAFPASDSQITLSLLIVYKGQIIHEYYRDGMAPLTRTRTWSTAKSIAATLIGLLVDDGRLSLDEPLKLDWLPQVDADEFDPRDRITLRHVLNMSSGLYPVDSFNMEYATGSGRAYWAGASSSVGARNRGLVREPGRFWDYENYDTLLAVLAMKRALGSDQAYLEFPKSALFAKIGMHNTILSTDRFGDFILSSQVYTNARDLARFGLLYLNDGVWQGERVISKDWIDFVRTPAPASEAQGRNYGGQFWLVPDNRTDVPPDTYITAGNRGQFVIIVPSHDLVIVRRGLDHARPQMNPWDIAAGILSAFHP